jgi:hypothetical protein
MSTSFGYIFWGLILVILDFKINRFDLLPDVIGYVLAGIGSAALHSISPKFSLAGSLSWMLAVASLIGLVFAGGAAIAFGILVTVMNCAMIWYLMGGIIDLTQAKNRQDLAEMAHNRRVAYVATTAAITSVAVLAHGSEGLALLLALLALIAMLVILALILHLIHRVRYEIAGD